MSQITYDHGQIESLVGQVRSTSGSLAGTLDDLRAYLAPMVADWSGQAAVTYGEHQRKWDEAAAALQQILTELANAAGSGNSMMQEADATASRAWG